MLKHRSGLHSTLACAIAATASTAAVADVLEEVTVTAQKREQSIQDVGISISAFTGDQLKAFGVKESFDIAAYTPGVHISGNLAGQNTQFTIRGVTQNDFNDIVEAPNAVYLDDGYIAVAQAQTFAVYDIDRVELLKGPQGTLFGRNATGGLVHYISKKPSFTKTEGYADVTLGYYDSNAHAYSKRVEAAIGGPFSERVAGRVAVMYNQHDGYLNNLYPSQAPTGPGSGPPGPGAGADMGDDDTYALRGTLDFKASDSVLLRVSANYAKSKLATGPYQSKSTIAVLNPGGELVNVINTPANETRLTQQGAADGGADVIDGDQFQPGGGFGLPGRPKPGGDFFGYIDPDGDGFDTSGDFAFKDQGSIETKGLNARVEWELADGLSFTSVSDFKDYQKLLFIDVDSAPVNQLANYAGVDATSFTQEFRLNGTAEHFRWVAGLYYLNIDNKSDNGLKAPENSLIGPVDIGVKAGLKTDSYSLFGQAEYDLTDKLTAILGARGIREKKDFNTLIGFFPSFDSFSVNQGTPLISPFGEGSPFRAAQNTSGTLWAGKAQLDYHVTDKLLLYGGINRGVKAGSFNAPLLGSYLGSGGDAGLPYGPETLIAYEAGFKSTLQDGRTRFNGSVFYYDYSDYQAFLFVGVGGVVINADAENVGAELELQTSPAKGWDLMLNASWFDATVKNILLRNGSPLPARDVKPTYAPEKQASAMVRYEWPGLGGLLHVRTDVSYSDSYFYNLRNFDADKFDSYVMVNAGVGWESNDERWQVGLDVRNVTDERAGIQGFDLAVLCGCNEVSYQPPRWYGLNVKVSF
ncbi:MAG: TonB-dependent receptor [Gammaproteobacteria bacterium]